MNKDTRTPRSLTTREQSTRPATWQVPDTLPAPEPQEGWVFRWIRTATMGVADPTNVHRSRREGWEPVRAEDHPEIAIIHTGAQHFEGGIEVGGLVLCKAPKEFMEQRAAHYAQLTGQQADAVANNLMKENDARMPLFSERKSSTTFGNGTK